MMQAIQVQTWILGALLVALLVILYRILQELKTFRKMWLQTDMMNRMKSEPTKTTQHCETSNQQDGSGQQKLTP